MIEKMLKGKVKHFYTKNDFHIITLTSNQKIQYIGECHLVKGDYIECDGEWQATKYGDTFMATDIRTCNSFSFLLSLVISGISEKKAEAIYEQYTYEEIKENPLILYDYFLTSASRSILSQIQEKRELFEEDTIDTIPKHLSKEIKGIGKKKVENWIEIYTIYYPFNISHFLSDNFLYYILSSETTRNMVQQVKKLDKIEKDYTTLRAYGVPDYVLKYIVRDMKDEMMKKIEEDIFILNDYFVPFPVIDKIGLDAFQMEKMSEKRVINGVLYVLMQNEKDGNTFMDYDTCLTQSEKVLDLDREKVKEIIDRNLSEGYDSEFKLDEDRLYRRVIYFTEQKLANMMIEKTREKSQYVPKWIDTYLDNTHLSKSQKECVKGVLKEKISILTGGPGTGKTTTLCEVCNCLDKMGKHYLLAAPTGKAAKRMSESTRRDSQTIYRLLEYSSRGKFGSFKRNENYKLYADYVIIDESSMLDVYILNSLMKAIHEKTSILFVGDVDQLPSVSMGSVFKDMKESHGIPTFALTEIFRQGLDSDIVQNAYHVKYNKPLVCNHKDFFFENVNTLGDVEEWISKLKSEFLILCPMRVGSMGTIELNKLMQKLKNKNKTICSHMGREFKVGDKVIQLTNNYDKNVFNGEMGYVKSGDKNAITIYYPDNTETLEITYEYKELGQIDLAYAITIHKSQGSEADNVLMVMDGNKDFISKELVYTGITRAKKKCFILSTFEIDFYKDLQVSNDRSTNLKNILIAKAKEN